MPQLANKIMLNDRAGIKEHLLQGERKILPDGVKAFLKSNSE